MSEEVEVLDEQRCLEYLHSANLGRVAFRSGDGVEILPVNYAWDGAIVIYRTAAGSRLELALQGPVAFEVDGWDHASRTGWSVVLKGVAHDVTAGGDPYSESLRERKVVPMAPGRRERWIAIYPSSITGRRFNATAWAASAGG
jgi:hypothetical protein